nr:immunoglobulin heavy chain junction region [Macaca mulatta]
CAREGVQWVQYEGVWFDVW